MSRKKIIISLAVIVGLAVIAVLYFGATITSRGYTNCRSNDGIEFCVDSESLRAEQTDDRTVNVKITNTTASTYKTYFNSTCTDPGFFFEDEYISEYQICGQAITDVEILPGRSVTYDDIVVPYDSLPEGQSEIYLSWNDKIRSNDIAVTT